MTPFQLQLSIKTSGEWAFLPMWQRLKEVKVPVLDCSGLFKDYDLLKVTALSADIAGMDALSLNYWFENCTIHVTVSKKE